MSRTGLLALVAISISAAAQAHGPAQPRYHVTELQVPARLRQSCVPGYVLGGSANAINDFGVAQGGFSCYSQVDLAAGVAVIEGGTFVAATGFGSLELPGVSADGNAFGTSINDRGEVFGLEVAEGGLFGIKWSLAGGRERVFDDPSCADSIRLSAAVDGNAHYLVGWGFRFDPGFGFCFPQRWLFRDNAGVETLGPSNGTPRRINAFDVAVGTANNSAVRYHVPTGQLTVLHAGDDVHFAEATDINDFGVVVGRVTDLVNGSFCGPSTVVRWARDGSERALPHLAGAVSSRVNGLDADGDAVGDSGPGAYCGAPDLAQERATLWQGNRAIDLNATIPRWLGITLTSASGINRRGQIAAVGFVDAEPLQSCVSISYETGSPVGTTTPCRRLHPFVLTPLGR